MRRTSQIWAVDELEAALGDACTEGSYSFSAAIARDEAESFPFEPLAELRTWGVSEVWIPKALGGAFETFEQPFSLGRTLSRRDPALALSCGMGIWTQLAWMAGDERQQHLVRDRIRAGAIPSLAVSEPAHGADLLASEVTASHDAGGWTLDGVKWPIGAASHTSLAFVLARTEADPGPRALSWLIVEGDALEKVGRLPAASTLGMRAADVGGLEFRGTTVEGDALLGGRGRGLELTLSLFQITRPLATSFALGATDTALRIATAFAAGRKLHRARAIDLPTVEDALIGALVDLLAADAVARSAVRGLHTHPEESSVGAAAAKVIVPELTGRAIRAASEVLGARYYLREGIASGMFQKLLRDQLVVGLFDGSTGVCLQGLAAQLPILLDPRPRVRDASGAARFSIDPALPAFDARRLAVGARGDFVLGSLAERVIDERFVEPRDRVLNGLAELRARLAAVRARGGAAMRSPLPAHLAHRYAVLHTAAACLQISANNSVSAVPPGWSRVAVRRLLEPDLPVRELASDGEYSGLRDFLLGAVSAPTTFALEPTRLFDSPIHDVLPRGAS